MKWTRLFMAQLRHALRTPWTFFFMLAAVAVALAVGLQPAVTEPERFLVAIVNEDTGPYGERLINNLYDYPQLDLRRMDRTGALALLRQDRLEAVCVIRPDYTTKLQKNEYRDLVDWYTAPSSRASATISEPLINGTMCFWIEEEAVRSTRAFLTGLGIAYTSADEESQREIIRQVWMNETAVHIESVVSGKQDLLPADRAAADAKLDPLTVCARWYAVFCVFYLVISASWVLDINRRGLRVRVSQSGAHIWQLLLGTSLSPLLIGLAGYGVVGAAACIASGGSWFGMLLLTGPVLVYLWTVLGLTIALASYLRQSLALLFLAPLITFVNAILGGLAGPLPRWANLLVVISRLLPSRWLQLALEAQAASAATASVWPAFEADILVPALLCCLGWSLAGLLLSELRRWKSYRGR